MKFPNLLLLFVFLLLSVNLSHSQNAKSKSQKSPSLIDDPVKIEKYVVDETGTLTTAQTNTLLKKLVDFDKTSSTQIVVYMISSLNGDPIEEVSIRLAEKNLIGQKGKDNGVLLLIVKNDRKLRIEVGYGLEGVLTDAIASQIIRNDITPSFKNGNFYEGIDNGIDAIIAVTKGEYTSTNDDGSDNNTPLCLGLSLFVPILFGVIFLLIFISIISKGSKWSSGAGKGSSGWSGFSSGGGSSSGSSSSFGGFSGGGGSFGGGGASGGW